MPHIAITAVTGALPAGFARLRAEARAGGYRHVERLATEWDAAATRFERDGEALLGAHVDGGLAGIGGLTLDPVEPGTLRMRRFFVQPACRRLGVGRALADELLGRARQRGLAVVVNAAAGSEKFWEALGFVAEARNGHTHRFGG